MSAQQTKTQRVQEAAQLAVYILSGGISAEEGALPVSPRQVAAFLNQTGVMLMTDSEFRHFARDAVVRVSAARRMRQDFFTALQLDGLLLYDSWGDPVEPVDERDELGGEA